MSSDPLENLDNYGDDHNDDGPTGDPDNSLNPDPSSPPNGNSDRTLLERLGLVPVNSTPLGVYAKKLKKFNMKDLTALALRKDDLLNGKNWIIWKTNVLRALRSAGLSAFPLGKAPSPNKTVNPDEYEAWESLDQAAMHFIHSNIKSERLMQIPGGVEVNGSGTPILITSAEFWDNVCDKHETFNSQAISNQIRALIKKQATDSTNIIKHLEEMESLRTTLENHDLKLEDQVFNAIVIGTLPTSWDSYTATIHGSLHDQKSRRLRWSQKGFSTVELVSNLTSEYERRIASNSSPDQTYQMTTSSNRSENFRKRQRDDLDACRICQFTNHSTSECRWKKNGQGYCALCQRGGHWTNNCSGSENDSKGKGKASNARRKKKGGGRNSANNSASTAQTASANTQSTSRNVSNHVVTMAANTNPTSCYGWLADSATTSHVACDENQFTVYRKIDQTITGVGNIHVSAIGRGTVNLTAHVDGSRKDIILNDVLHVPTATDSLFSVGRFVERGNTFFADKTGGYFYNSDGHLIMTSKLENALFSLNASIPSEKVNVVRGTHSWLEWHKRFGHVAVSGLQHLRRRNLVDGFDVDETSELVDCETCVQAKQHRAPFPKTAERTSTYPGEVTHCDLWGPARFTATNGARYYMTFIDDYSRHCTLKLLARKSDAPQKMKDYLAWVECQLGKVPKIVMTDNGTEFVNNDLREWFDRHGKKLDTSSPYSPQQNGVAERYNRTLGDLIRAMLLGQRIPKVLWGTAALHAVYLRNRAYTRTLPDKTPLERWCGKRPNVDNLQEFGIPASILSEAVGRDKLDPRGEIHIFLGFEDGPKAIRYYDVKTKQVKISRNYHFLPNAENPPHFEGEQLEDDEELWEPRDLESDKGKDKEKNDAPLMIRIPKRANVSLESDEESEEERPSKRHKTKSSEPYVSAERSLYANVIYAAFNETTMKEARESAEWPQWKEAMETELNQLRQMGTWELVDLPEGRRAVGNRWVLIKKYLKSGQLDKYKARLVAKGYSQVPGMDFSETFSPVVRLETIRTILALTVNFDWELTQMDVKGAYLNGNLEEEVYMLQPEGFGDGTNKVCHLIKTLYGLKQAGREWNKVLNTRLKDIGFKNIKADPCAFIRETNEHIEIITAWVDDLLLFTETAQLMDALKAELKTLFDISDLGSPQKIVGIEIDRDRKNGRLKISQTQYIDDLLAKYNMTDCKPVATPMDVSIDLNNAEELPNDSPIRTLYRTLVGELMFLAIATRPDEANVIRKLAMYISKPGEIHWRAAKRVLRYLKGVRTLGITYVKDPNLDKRCLLHGCSDASFNSEEGAKSVTGFVFTCAGGAITWGSRKQSLTALSATEAECLALTEATQEAVWLRTLLEELRLPQTLPTPMQEDNQGTIALSENPQFHRRSKHFLPKLHFIREKVADQTISIEYCPTEEMMADVLTKALPKDAHQSHVHRMGMTLD
jgi:transposase InsO family protein